MKFSFAIFPFVALSAFAISHRPTLPDMDKYLISLGFHQNLVSNELWQHSDRLKIPNNTECTDCCTNCLIYKMFLSVLSIEVSAKCSRDPASLSLDDQVECKVELDIALQKSLQYIKYGVCYYKKQKFTSARSRERMQAYLFGFFERYLSESDIFTFVTGQGIHPCYIPKIPARVEEAEKEVNIITKRKTLQQLEEELDEALVGGMPVPEICLIRNVDACNEIAESWVEVGKKAVLLTRKIAHRKAEERNSTRRNKFSRI